ncbi:hypothetical protein GCM10022393_35370 [Aquimarina addita]|uniref:Uncharacterized protein n=1 Tax=Aquimarina addita TaxID=870485 RepID=A0ABP6UQI8_9FLAO
MKNDIEDIDALIKETLTEEEAKFYDDLEEQNLLEMFGGLFKTKQAWLMIIMNIVNIIGLVFLIYCTIQFLNTDTTNELIKWLAAGGICLTFMIMIKLFSWMQMDKNALLREIKRLELQVSSLASRVS